MLIESLLGLGVCPNLTAFKKYVSRGPGSSSLSWFLCDRRAASTQTESRVGEVKGGRMETRVDLHAQLASIMEVLANAAVAEICKLVDDGFASLRMEITRSQRENQVLKSRLRLMEGRTGEQPHTEPTPPQQPVSRTRRDQHFREDSPAITKRKVKTTMMENTDTGSQPVGVTEQPAEPEVVVIKKERLEEELTGCSVTTPNSTIGPPTLCLAAECVHPLSVEIPSVSVSGEDEKQSSVCPVVEACTLGHYSHPADQNHRAALRASGPNRAREMTDLAKEEEKHVVGPSDSVFAESSGHSVPDVETPLMKTLDSELGLSAAAADWRGEAVLAVKLKADPSWSEAFRTQSPLVSLVGNDMSVSNSRLTNSNSLHAESEPAEMDTGSLDSSSFDDLFSSPEVARSLTAAHKHSPDGVAGTEEPLASSLFSFLGSGSSFGNSSISDSLTVSSLSNTSSDSRSRSFLSSTSRALSCQQCGRLFSTSRDLVVHQRSHAGERIYHCHLCKKPFIHAHQLKTHQRVHTGEKPFSCAQCGKRFSQSSHIKRHMSVHTGEKRYSCSLCGKRFSQACSLKVHQAVHTGERPYSCTKCGKSFSLLGNLVRHQSIHIDNEVMLDNKLTSSGGDSRTSESHNIVEPVSGARLCRAVSFAPGEPPACQRPLVRLSIR
ncbi:hypothetical protein L3Q82_005194 [Scortum barcoo]|uniref:Uncharacterized protein n=1 Tax=Scortum barcoo TaxID=214431 RepID=A0ACB8V9V7_9TELE|nr:hypothetical protein L3Q82_005194 [Scortum barcoo]